ncbi:UNVERIFIED_CONTAM: hypothetical protein K2H54_065839, partial [Gekko kuhli]
MLAEQHGQLFSSNLLGGFSLLKMVTCCLNGKNVPQYEILPAFLDVSSNVELDSLVMPVFQAKDWSSHQNYCAVKSVLKHSPPVVNLGVNPEKRLNVLWQLLYEHVLWYRAQLNRKMLNSSKPLSERQIVHEEPITEALANHIQAIIQSSGEKLDKTLKLNSVAGEEQFLIGLYKESVAVWEKALQETKGKDAELMIRTVHTEAILAVVQSLARFMAAYFTNEPLFVLPPHNVAVLPPLHIRPDPIEEEDANVLFKSVEEILKAAVMADADILSEIFQLLMDCAKDLSRKFCSLVPEGLYLPAPPLYCPQPAFPSEEEYTNLPLKIERECRQKVSGVVQRILLLFRAAHCSFPAAQWYIVQLKRARKIMQKIRKKGALPLLNNLPENLLNYSKSHTIFFKPTSSGDSGFDVISCRTIECFRELCALCWMLHVRERLSDSCRRYQTARENSENQKVMMM